MAGLIVTCGALCVFILFVFYSWRVLGPGLPSIRASAPGDGIEIRTQRLMHYNEWLHLALGRLRASNHAAAPNAAKVGAQRSAYAYLFDATSDPYACSLLVNIELLRSLRSTLAVHVLVSSDVGHNFAQSLRELGAGVDLQKCSRIAEDARSYYKDCLLKLLAFKMYKIVPGLERVLVLDSDQLILRKLYSMFEGLPEIDLAAPRAYWLAKDHRKRFHDHQSLGQIMERREFCDPDNSLQSVQYGSVNQFALWQSYNVVRRVRLSELILGGLESPRVVSHFTVYQHDYGRSHQPSFKAAVQRSPGSG